MKVLIEIEADAEGYRYRLSCIHAGKNIEKSEYTEDLKHTLNAKYLLALNEALKRMVQKSEIEVKIAESGTVAAVPEAGSRAYDTCGNQVEKVRME